MSENGDMLSLRVSAHLQGNQISVLQVINGIPWIWFLGSVKAWNDHPENAAMRDSGTIFVSRELFDKLNEYIKLRGAGKEGVNPLALAAPMLTIEHKES